MHSIPNQEIRNLRRNGQVSEAHCRAYELLEEHRDDHNLKNELGWVIYEKIKGVVSASKRGEAEDEHPVRQTRELLREYARLDLPRPDLLFSLLVATLLRLPGKLAFAPRFLQWAGLDSFRREDYFRQEGSDDEPLLDSLIDKAARLTSKLACEADERETDLKEFAVALLDRALDEAEIGRRVLLQYRKGLLLTDLGRSEEARITLAPVVKAKRSEFWAWHALAKSQEQEHPTFALALCAKAFLICGNQNFSVRVVEDMARLALVVGEYDLAKWSVDKALSIRQLNTWTIPESLEMYVRADWYAAAASIADATRILEECAETGEERVFTDCHRDASYLGTFESQSGRTMVKVGLREGGSAIEVVGPARRLSKFEDERDGAPVTVGILLHDEKYRIVGMEPRPEGALFDCLPSIFGVIDHQNQAKEFASVYITASAFCVLPYERFESAGALPEGSAVRLWCTRRRDRLNAFQVEPASFMETESIKQVCGAYTAHIRGFGFVAGVYVFPKLAEKLTDGAEVTGVAVLKTNRKTGLPGWALLAITDCIPPGAVT